MTDEATHTQPASQIAPSVESITQLVHGFYGDVRRDPLLGPVFEKALHGQWDAHLQRLVDFWSTVALGTRSFKGDVFGKHMALEGVMGKEVTFQALFSERWGRFIATEIAVVKP